VSDDDWRIFFPIPLRCDSQGNPWTANYIVSSGNLLADMRYNVTAESQGRLQAARLYNLTQARAPGGPASENPIQAKFAECGF
jgi:hypothetical protein